jgi:hypothetical protein
MASSCRAGIRSLCHDAEINFSLITPNYTISLGWFSYCHMVILLFDVIPITSLQTVLQKGYFHGFPAVCMAN